MRTAAEIAARVNRRFRAQERMKLFMDWWLGLTGGTSIALVALDYTFAGAGFGLLSEVGFFYASYRSRMLSLWILTVWWTIWWGVMFWRNWP